MELKTTYEDGYVLASTVGPIDHSAAEAFGETLHPYLRQGGAKVVLDLSQSKTITSEGIGRLASLVASATMYSSRVVLAACSTFVSVVLHRCKMDTYFEIAETVPDAIRLVLGEAI